MNDDNDFISNPITMHACKESAVSEISVPRSNLIFCVQSVSYCNGKIKVVTSIETRERKHAGNQSPRIEDVVILEDCYTLEVGHFLSVNKENTEPIDSHSHE